MKTTVIRASSLSGYADCPRRTAARTIAAEIDDAGFTLRATPKSIGGAVGTSMHAGAAHLMEHKKKTGLMGNPVEAEHVALEKLAEETAGDVAWDGDKANLNLAQQQTVSMLNVCRQDVITTLTPVDVELRLEAKLREDLVLSGQVDVSSEYGIVDWKTGKIRRANGPQYGAYLLLARSHGMQSKGAAEVYIKRVGPKTEQPRAEIHQYEPGTIENSAISIIKHMDRDMKAFREAGDPREFLANPQSMMCSDTYCPAWGTAFCKEHKK